MEEHLNTPCVSFSSGIPFARVTGGAHNSELLFIDEKGTCQAEISDSLILECVNKVMLKNKKPMAVRTRMATALFKHLKFNKEPVDDELISLYFAAKAELSKRDRKEIKLTEGTLSPVPNIEKRDTIYVSGQSGSGKSTWVKNYCEAFSKIYPDRPIFLFSKVEDDPAFSAMIHKKIITKVPLDESLVKEPITTEELANSLAIFDDTDTVKDKEIKAAVDALINDILQTGRHSNTYIIRTSHQIANYRETAITLNESNTLVVFPHTNRHQIDYVLKNYVGLDNETIKKIRGLPSRWVVVYKNYPQYVYYEQGAFVV